MPCLEKEEITKPEHVDYYMDPKNIIKLLEANTKGMGPDIRFVESL